jgi:membrane protease YdiL (CAAX protease family)
MKKQIVQSVGYFAAGFIALYLVNKFYSKTWTLPEIIIMSLIFTVIHFFFGLRNKK